MSKLVGRSVQVDRNDLNKAAQAYLRAHPDKVIAPVWKIFRWLLQEYTKATRGQRRKGKSG